MLLLLNRAHAMNQPMMMTAYTAQPNTPETDLMDKVPHIVTWTLAGQNYEKQVFAPCPLSAIEIVRSCLNTRENEN